MHRRTKVGKVLHSTQTLSMGGWDGETAISEIGCLRFCVSRVFWDRPWVPPDPRSLDESLPPLGYHIVHKCVHPPDKRGARTPRVKLGFRGCITEVLIKVDTETVSRGGHLTIVACQPLTFR